MRLSFDPAKNDRNIAERGLSFELLLALDWDTAVTIEDTRKDYGETRLRVMARLGGRLHVAVISRRGDATHVISFRKANKKEVKLYDKQKG